MNLQRLVTRAIPLALGLALSMQGHAASIVTSGTFSADNSFGTYNFSTATSQNYTFTSTSYAGGNFLPVLTLFNATSGAPVDYSNSGLGDVSLFDSLSAGSYVLYITEYPNVAIGSLSGGFLFAGDPTATGDQCTGLSGKSFINDTTCSATPLGKNYSVTVTNTAVTPEPSTFALVLLPALMAVFVVRSRIA